jgi:hypothetical protein
MPSPVVNPSDDVFLQTAQLRARYGGVSHMWVERRLAGDPDFPRPTYISRRRFWRLADLVEWERLNAARPAQVPA